MIKVLALLGLTLAATKASAGEEILRLNAARDAFRNGYSSATTHKAFAQSPDGAWGWMDNRTSAQIAAEDAIAMCSKSLKPGERPCVVVHVDDRWFSY